MEQTTFQKFFIMKKVVLFVVFGFFSFALFGQGIQYKSKYPDIPIVDVHSHARGVANAANLIKMSEVIKQKYGSNLAFWIGLSHVANPAEMKAATNNRMLFAVTRPVGRFEIAPRPHNAYEGVGINNYADEVVRKVRNEGYVGIKIHFGLHAVLRSNPDEVIITRLDDHRLAQFFSRLEEDNVLMTSLHIAEPSGPFDNRPTDRYLRTFTHNDPVFFWEQIRAFENVLAKYPNLTIVAAHLAFLYVQDAQIDYLRYLLSTYPNLYVDISAMFHHMHYPSRDNLRDFFIEYQDRILFGMDFGDILEHNIERDADNYTKFFAILETDQIINLGFNLNIPTKGIDLPREVLEKVYYKNALKLYQGLREAMEL
jgi:predicted TIM-barrel fold metal-dependent hydrolase